MIQTRYFIVIHVIQASILPATACKKSQKNKYTTAIAVNSKKGIITTKKWCVNYAIRPTFLSSNSKAIFTM